MQMRQPLFRIAGATEEKLQVWTHILAFLPGSDSFVLFIHPSKKNITS